MCAYCKKAGIIKQRSNAEEMRPTFTIYNKTCVIKITIAKRPIYIFCTFYNNYFYPKMPGSKS